MPETGKDQLRAELARLRDEAGLSGEALGAALQPRRSQGTVWRIEQGKSLPTIPVVRSWLEACGADAETTARVLGLAYEVRGRVHGWSELLGPGTDTQESAADIEESATLVRVAQPTLVPGLLQTPEYARAVFGIGRIADVEKAVAGRVARQARLHEPGRRFVFLIGWQALRWPIGGEDVAAAQRDRVVSLSRLAQVEVAVVPDTVAVVSWWHNFILWTPAEGEVFATAELVDGEHEARDADAVAAYEQVWSRLWDAAAHGAEAIDLLHKMNGAD